MRAPVFFILLFFVKLLPAQEVDVQRLLDRINSIKNHDPKYTTCTKISDSLLEAGKYSEAYKFIQTLVRQYEKLAADSFTPALYNITGNFYTSTANYNQALDAFVISSDLYKKQNRPKGMCSAVTNMGNAYYYLGNADKALEFYKKALAINEERVHDEEVSSNIYNNIGIIYSLRKNYGMGMQFFHKALRVYLKQNDSLSMGQTYNNFATVLMEQNKLDSAYYFFEQAMKLKQKHGSKADIVDSYNNMAQINLKRNDHASALKYLEKNMLLLDTSVYSPELKQAYLFYYEIYQKKNNPALAFKYYKLYRAMGDTIDAHNKTSELTQKEITMEVSKAHLADSLKMAEETKIRDLELVQKKKENVFLIISLSVAGLIALLLYNRFRVTHKQKLIIDEQKKIVELKQKEVLDSIHYAKRIQQSLLTSEKYIERILNQAKNKK